MRRTIAFAVIALTAVLCSRSLNAKANDAFRPPAVPLVTSDPYLSIWSEADHLNDDVTKHWTHHSHSLVSLVRIDGKAYRLMGNEPRDVPPLPQTSVKVLPTRSVYEFANPQVRVTMTFLTPALPDDLDALTLPLSYITWEVRSADGAAHRVSIYDSTSSQLVVNAVSQEVTWSREKAGGLTALKVGSVEQTLLEPAGDDTRIDWGYAYAAAPANQTTAAIGADQALLRAFVENGTLPGQDDSRMPRAVKTDQPVLAFAFDLGDVNADAVSRHVMVAYDEIYSINWFGKKLRPYWRRNGAEAGDMLQSAERDYAKLSRRCEQFDDELMADLTKVGGERYAQISALAYRQALAACGIAADANKQPLLFTKENTSNGDLATVDVFYPMDPVLIFLSPSLAKASVVPALVYAASDHWKFPNAPHDLGTYPEAMGRDDGGEGMPVEESGNMILLCDAIAHADGNGDFVTPWWPQLTQWAKYLEQYGLDPANQLCTDDFMGHLAHNANLSVKAILALAAYGDLCKMRGDQTTAQRYFELAKADAAHWMKVAAEGDHYRLAFDKPNTWSQKYNLVWDRLLNLNVFPPDVAKKEVAYYKTVMQKYGVPLDSRTKLTKTDWSVWSATLADDPADFEAILSPIWDYLNQTSARDPLADSYITNDIKSGGMHARPVVGGIFIKMLADPAVWKKWADRDQAKVGNWDTRIPPPPQVSVVVPTAQQEAISWRYTTRKPADDWFKPDFDDSSWKQGPAGFGTEGTPGAVVRTTWNTDDIWVRREFEMPAGQFPNLELLVHHDEDVEVYLNGILAARASGFTAGYQPLPIGGAARASLKPGKNTIAAHCHQTTGGQYIDLGFVTVVEQANSDQH